MRTAAIVCNVVVFAVTGIIVLTEGVPKDARYAVLTFLVLLVPLLSAVVLVRERVAPPAPGVDGGAGPAITLTRRAAALCNLVLLGAACWAAVTQYPYPEGNGVIPFAVLVVCAPILSLMALLGGRRSAVREQRGRAAGGEQGGGT